MITRVQAIKILDEHGKTPAEATDGVYDMFGEFRPDADSSFDNTVGVKEEYKKMEVLGFLGYCCLTC